MIKNWLIKNKLSIALLVLISAGYFGLRLPNLTLQPIFADESIYIRWAQVMRAEPGLRFISVTDGKTPLYMWLMIPLFSFFKDPLLAGRMLSVIFGYLSLVGVAILGWRFVSKRVGLIAAFLMAVVPFMVFFDRMALVDSMLVAFSIWSLVLALLLVIHPRLDVAMFLGYLLGGGILTKTPGFFNLLILPSTIVAIKNRQNLLKVCGLWLVAVIIALGIYNILRLGPGFANLSSRNQDYIFSPVDLIGRPLDPFLPHLDDLRDWFPKLLTWPVVIFLGVGLLRLVATRDKKLVAIVLWGEVPLLVLMALLKTFTARYILSAIPVLLILAAFGVDLCAKKGKLWLALAVLVLLPLALLFDGQLLINPARANLPAKEKQGYFEDWTAGVGLEDIAQFLISQARNGLIIVGTGGNFGTLPDGLSLYLDRYNHQAPESRKIVLVGGEATISAYLKEQTLLHPTYFVVSRSQLPPTFAVFGKVELIKEYPKASNRTGAQQDAMLLFKVIP